MAKDKETGTIEPMEDMGLSAQADEYVSRSGGRIQAQVSSFKEGLQVYSKISIVRVRSRDTNLLIMEDYMPIIGEIDGGVDFIGKDFVKSIDGVRGFFCHDHNVFFLLLKEQSKPGKARSESQLSREEGADGSFDEAGIPAAEPVREEEANHV